MNIKPVIYVSKDFISKEDKINNKPLHTEMKHKKIAECIIMGKNKVLEKGANIIHRLFTIKKYIQNFGMDFLKNR
ncbi:MAG: hypothetical protein N4A62_13680 [Marinisporobacter sp.]|jgi:hypothetical protein|nr:hypothetical protein [Marinisporobacter sp.]